MRASPKAFGKTAFFKVFWNVLFEEQLFLHTSLYENVEKVLGVCSGVSGRRRKQDVPPNWDMYGSNMS